MVGGIWGANNTANLCVEPSFFFVFCFFFFEEHGLLSEQRVFIEKLT